LESEGRRELEIVESWAAGRVEIAWLYVIGDVFSVV